MGETVEEARRCLEALVRAIEEGELEAGALQLAYLHGALAMVDGLLSTGESPTLPS